MGVRRGAGSGALAVCSCWPCDCRLAPCIPRVVQRQGSDVDQPDLVRRAGRDVGLVGIMACLPRVSQRPRLHRR